MSEFVVPFLLDSNHEQVHWSCKSGKSGISVSVGEHGNSESRLCKVSRVEGTSIGGWTLEVGGG